MFKWATFREILLASSGDDGRSISQNVAHLNILVHDVINLLYYEYWTDKQKYFYVYSGTFSMTEPYNMLQEIRHFADNLGRSSNITTTWAKLTKYRSL